MDEAPSQTIRCPGTLPDGSLCRSPLWRVVDGGIEIRVRVRQNEHIEISAAGPALAQITTRCPRCKARWWPSSPMHPTPAGASSGVIRAVDPNSPVAA